MLDAQPIIDPHHHLWDLGRNTYPWLQDRTLALRLEGDLRPIANGLPAGGLLGGHPQPERGEIRAC